METCGVILAGGKGSRLGELTKVTNKHLLGVGNSPMVLYPLRKLVGAGIKEILVVSGTEHMGAFLELLGSGKDYGCELTYRVQDEAGGIAQALGLARRFGKDRRIIVILGDQIFSESLHGLIGPTTVGNYAWLAFKKVRDPERFGVGRFDDTGRLIEIIEKPNKPPSNSAVTGIYSYPPDVFDVIDKLKPSSRGELEITDVNNYYITAGRLSYYYLNGYWVDAGTVESLAAASDLVLKWPPSF